MAGSTVLSPEAVLRMKEMYEERDGRGRRVHSLMSLGKTFGVSETTVLRVVKSYGAFMDAPAPTPEMSQQEVEASAAKLLALLDTPAPGGKPAKDMADMTEGMRDRLIGYNQWTDEDERAWRAKTS